MGHMFAVAGALCFGIAITWGIAIMVSYGIQWLWAWIDDSKVTNYNWLMRRVNNSKWKYPVVWHDDDLYGYAKDKKYSGQYYGNIPSNEYVEKNKVPCGRLITVFIISTLSPLITVISYLFYPVVLSLITLLLIMHLARYTRRFSKKFKGHVADKNAHSTDED